MKSLQTAFLVLFLFSSFSLFAQSSSHSILDNLINNGNFVHGNQMFTSDCKYSPQNLVSEGTYAIVTNPRDAHYLFVDTVLPNNGAFLAINGNFSSNSLVWSQQIKVEEGVVYKFSADFAKICGGANAQLTFFVGETKISETHTVNTELGQFNPYFGFWKSNTSGMITVSVRNSCVSGGGNDFAIDNLNFHQVFEQEIPQNTTIYETITSTEPNPTISTEGVTAWDLIDEDGTRINPAAPSGELLKLIEQELSKENQKRLELKKLENNK